MFFQWGASKNVHAGSHVKRGFFADFGEYSHLIHGVMARDKHEMAGFCARVAQKWHM